jgi:hypothetical protein
LETNDTIIQIEGDSKILKISGRGLSESDIIEDFKYKFQKEFKTGYELLPYSMELDVLSESIGEK